MPVKRFGSAVRGGRNMPAGNDPAGRSARGGGTFFLRTMALAAAAAAMVGGLALMPAPAVRAQASVAAPAYSLTDEADLFMHYSLMGDMTLAKHFARAILKSNPKPVVLLRAFEAAANGRNISEILLRNQKNMPLRDVSVKIAALLEEGQIALARNPDRIKTAIAHMVISPRAFVVSRQRLTAAGEFAAPFFIAAMNNPADRSEDPYIVQMMSDIGKPLVNPLVQALQTRVPAEKIQFVQVLGNIGYAQALPYLKAIAADPKSSPVLVQAAKLAVQKIDRHGFFAHLNAAESFVNLGWRYFYNSPTVAANQPNEATNPVWYFNQTLNNVVATPVPTVIWKDVQTMRAAKDALRLDPKNPTAISLWLAADTRCRIDLPAGQANPTQPAGTPSAHYYAVAAGPLYLNPVLDIALSQHNTSLILHTIAALAQTGGVQGLVGTGKAAGPLMTALSYPDPQVRFGAAFALAKANPAQKFMGWFRVPTVLAEAVAQAGKPAAILVDANAQNRNRMRAILSEHYHVYDAPHFAQALVQARWAAYIGLVVIPGGAPADRMLEMAATDERLQYVPVLVTGPVYDVPKLKLEYVNQSTVAEIANSADSGAIDAALEHIKNRLHITTMGASQAAKFSIEASHLLRGIAMNRGSIYDANAALPALVTALHDSNSAVALAAAGALGQMRNPQAQLALAQRALQADSHSAVAVQQALLLDLAASARNVGNHLSTDSIQRLIRMVKGSKPAKVRTAAATALGALNVPSNQAAELILTQTH